MPFAALEPEPALDQLQRSLRQGRVGHAYLFAGPDLDALELAARTLAKTLNCLAAAAPKPGAGADDCCDACDSCHRIDQAAHPDVLWIRPESKIRLITIDQVREVLHRIGLKPTSARWKVTVLVAADRMNAAAANAFLKTLEEPPAQSILILLSTDPARLLETIRSRCQRFNFSPAGSAQAPVQESAWLTDFATDAAKGSDDLLARYRLVSRLLARLGELRQTAEETLRAASPLTQYDDLETALEERWQNELNAAVEAEYRRRRCAVLETLHWWMRDIWLSIQKVDDDLLAFPALRPFTAQVADRISLEEAQTNLQAVEHTQRQLDSNAQEALVLEVGLLRLRL